MKNTSQFLIGTLVSKKLLATLIGAAATFAIGGGVHANTITYSGVLTDTPGYHRPSYTNNFTPAFNCSNCGFHSAGILVDTSGTYTFSILSSDFPDQVNILYSNNFNPANPMTNFVGPLSYATYMRGNSKSLSLLAGVQYFWVTSTDFGFSNANCSAGCNFTTQVRGPGDITATVPEPSTWAMLLIGFGSIGSAMRSRGRFAAMA